MELTVTPREYLTLLEIRDRAARTPPTSDAESMLFGTALNDDVWIAGVRQLFGEPTTTLMLHNEPVRIFVDYSQS